MGELLIAVLLVSILWIIWDMAKMFLEERQELPETDVVREPGRQKLNQYAEAFERLSEIFMKLPKGRECLSKEDMDGILREVSAKVCRGCEAADWCWREHREDTCRQVYHRLEEIEKGEEDPKEAESFREFCIWPDRFSGELMLKFQLARQNLLWTNRLLESRQVMMDQFREIARSSVWPRAPSMRSIRWTDKSGGKWRFRCVSTVSGSGKCGRWSAPTGEESSM